MLYFFRRIEMTDEKELIKSIYKEKGAQQLGLAEYEALQKKNARKFKLNLNAPAKIVLSSPLLLLFCFGLFFLPFLVLKLATAPVAPAETETDKDFSYERFFKKEKPKLL